jgi:hypothetical protein
MNRSVLVIATVVALSSGGAVSAQDNPVLRDYFGRAAKKALAKHNSEESAWYSEKSEDHKEWAEKTVGVGRFKKTIKTIVVEWTQESKTWVWLDDSDKNLNINITKFELKDGTLQFGVTASGKAKGKAWGKIPNVVTADVKTSSNVEITIEGKAKISDSKFKDVEISKLTGKLSDLRFNKDALKAVQGLVQDCANEYVKFKNDDLKKDMKKTFEDFSP